MLCPFTHSRSASAGAVLIARTAGPAAASAPIASMVAPASISTQGCPGLTP